MFPDFSPKPNLEAAGIIADKALVVKSVFAKLLPEIRLRAFTVAGVESMNALQRIKDAITDVPLGEQTWDQAKKQIVEDLEPYLGDGADYRATLALRMNTFPAFSTAVHRVGMEDDDTTAFQYLHGECKVPTESHLALNGVIVPKNDPFWDTHTGPWGHLGCVCYKRPMNEDLVAEEKAKDEKRNPEDRNVIEGPALKKLNQGEIIRAGQRHDITIDGPDNDGFKWNPDDLRLPIGDILLRYDPDIQKMFIAEAKKMMVGNTTVWNWLTGTKPPQPPPAERARQDKVTAAAIADQGEGG